MFWKVKSYLGNNSKVGVHGAGGIFLHSNDWDTESGLQLRMSDVRLLHSETHRPDKSFKLRGFPSEIVVNKGDLGHHPLPTFPPRFTGLQHFKYFCLRLGSRKNISCQYGV